MKHKKNRNEIFMQCAFNCFLIYGYAHTSIDDIIKKSGGSKLSLYSFFGSKEELYFSVCEAVLYNCRRSLREFQENHNNLYFLIGRLSLLALISTSNGSPKADNMRSMLYDEILIISKEIESIFCNSGHNLPAIFIYGDVLKYLSSLILRVILCGFNEIENILIENFLNEKKFELSDIMKIEIIK